MYIIGRAQRETLRETISCVELPEKYKAFNLSRAKTGVTAIYSELK